MKHPLMASGTRSSCGADMARGFEETGIAFKFTFFSLRKGDMGCGKAPKGRQFLQRSPFCHSILRGKACAAYIQTKLDQLLYLTGPLVTHRFSTRSSTRVREHVVQCSAAVLRVPCIFSQYKA